MKALLLSPAWHRMSTVEDPASRYLGAHPIFAGGSVLDPVFPARFIDLLRRHRPEYVVAMTPLILGLITQFQQTGQDLRELFGSVKTLMVLGLPITPGLREYLRQQTGVDAIWDRGGSTEGLAMDECEYHDHQHIYEDTVYCEVIGADGQPVPDGERGRLVFTKLNFGPSPIIRYDSGDLAAFATEPCRCGHSMRRLQLFGRGDGCIQLPGRMLIPWDVRLLVEADPELIGRNLLLVRDAVGWRGVTLDQPACLHLVIEGDPCNEAQLRNRLLHGLELDEIRISWAGKVALQWSFRQVVNRSELPFLDRDEV
jgi:hypothetical protein